MNAVDLLKRLHQHRAWVNGNLLTADVMLISLARLGIFEPS